MRLNFFKSPIFLIAATVILCVGALQLGQVQVFQRLEWMTYDWRVRLVHAYAGHTDGVATNLGFCEISDNTIAAVDSGEFGYQFGLYWPRQVYTRGLTELNREGAKAVAFDVLFAERRPDQPPMMLPDGSTIGSDESFAEELKKCGNVILAGDTGVLPDPLFQTNSWRIGNISTQRDPDGVLRRDQAFAVYNDWHPIIKTMAREYSVDLGKTAFSADKLTFHREASGEVIEIPLNARGMIDTSNFANPVPAGVPLEFAPYTPVRVWSMGIALAAYQLKLDLDHPDLDLPAHRVTLHGEHGLTRVIPVDERGYFYIDWSIATGDPALAKGQFETLLAVPQELAAGHPVTDHWRDKLVVVGSTATGNDLTDMGATPLENSTYLASKHWNVANSIITGRFIKTTPVAISIILVAVMGAWAAWLTSAVTRPASGSFLMVVTAIAYVAIAVTLFAGIRLWVPIVLPLVCAGFVTHLSALTYRLTLEQSEKKLIRSLFTRLVSPEVVNEVIKAKSLSSLAGERREMTILFADIRGFTELTDAAQEANTTFLQRHDLSGAKADDYLDKQAKEVMETVSLYLGVIADCVKKHDGTLDKYIGDCVMAFWGAPLPNPRHARCAVRCAIEAQQALNALNEKRKEENLRRARENEVRGESLEAALPMLPVLAMGTGINTGMAIAGFMGSQAHIVNYTAFGREVNLASRLEGVSGFSRIIIGEGTWNDLKRDDPDLAKTCIELPPQPVKGFRGAVRIFEVPWKNPTPAVKPNDNVPAAS